MESTERLGFLKYQRQDDYIEQEISDHDVLLLNNIDFSPFLMGERNLEIYVINKTVPTILTSSPIFPLQR